MAGEHLSRREQEICFLLGVYHKRSLHLASVFNDAQCLWAAFPGFYNRVRLLVAAYEGEQLEFEGRLGVHPDLFWIQKYPDVSLSLSSQNIRMFHFHSAAELICHIFI